MTDPFPTEGQDVPLIGGPVCGMARTYKGERNLRIQVPYLATIAELDMDVPESGPQLWTHTYDLVATLAGPVYKHSEIR